MLSVSYTHLDIPETVPDDLADLSSLTDGMDDADKTPMEASDNTESVESTENAAENGDAGGLDDDLDALLAGAFPEQSENSTDNASGEPESADVMDILKLSLIHICSKQSSGDSFYRS